MHFGILYAALGICLATTLCRAETETYSQVAAGGNIIYRDVAIIGGGSSGIYNAVALRDRNKSVVVIEKKGRLGGHAETFVDPTTGKTIDIGVVVYHQQQTTRDYFARFNVPLIKIDFQSVVEFVEFATGQSQPDFRPPGPKAFAAALDKYDDQLKKYPALQHSFNLTYPVPKDLLLPFGDFVEKYKLGAIPQSIFAINQGFAPLLKIPVLYMLKYLNAPLLYDFANGQLTTKNQNSSEIYFKAGKFLGASNVLLNSTVVSAERSTSPYSYSKPFPIKLHVHTPAGARTIFAKKLISAVPPTVSNLSPLGLSETETSLFSKFFPNGYYTGVLNNTGLPTNISLRNVDPDRPYSLPALPGIYALSPAVGGLTRVYYGSPTPLPAEDVKRRIEAAVMRVQAARRLPVHRPDWFVFSDHSPFNLMAPIEDVEQGFYKRLAALQGQRNTFYTGAAFSSQDSSVIWDWNRKYLLPKIYASLEEAA